MQKIIVPFMSGFLASIFFREAALGILHAAGLIAPNAFLVAPFAPLPVPEFIMHAVIGAFLALPMAWLLRVEPARPAPWVAALVYGAIALTAVRTFVVDPIRGVWPGSSMLSLVVIGIISNALWGWGALMFMRAFMSDDDWDETQDD